MKHLWFITPTDKTLEVYGLDQGRYYVIDTYEGDAVVRAEPFEAIEIALSGLWEE